MREVSDGEVRDIGRLIAVIEEFRQLDAQMPVQTLATFLHVAQQQGQNMSELARKMDLEQSSMSRNLTAWTDVDSTKRPGHDMIIYDTDKYVDARQKLASLNSRGRAFLTRVLRALEK